MSLGLIYIRLLEQENRDSHSTSLRSKMKPSEMRVRRLLVKTIVTYAIWGALILLVLTTLISCKRLSSFPQSFYCAAPSELHSPTRKCMKLEIQIDV